MYHQIDNFSLTWKLTVILNIIAGAVFLAGFFLFLWLYGIFSDDRFAIKLFENSDIMTVYVLVFVQVFFHEYSHAIGYKIKGGRVKYGIKWLCPYCREITGLYYATKDFVLTLVLPLITGTIAGVLAAVIFPQYLYYIMICMLTNISGASGDVFMLFYILSKTEKGGFIRDESYGFSIHRKVIA